MTFAGYPQFYALNFLVDFLKNFCYNPLQQLNFYQTKIELFLKGNKNGQSSFPSAAERSHAEEEY